jgi:nicotinic acid mononucleotide adenylyltransferase
VLAAATDLRTRVRQGLAVGDLVPPPVARYIGKYGLYQQGV